jgi:hypothetical protein
MSWFSAPIAHATTCVADSSESYRGASLRGNGFCNSPELTNRSPQRPHLRIALALGCAAHGRRVIEFTVMDGRALMALPSANGSCQWVGWSQWRIYRDLDRVHQVWGDCQDGRYEVGIQPGHPLGFYSHTYSGEVALCQVLIDPSGELTDLGRAPDSTRRCWARRSSKDCERRTSRWDRPATARPAPTRPTRRGACSGRYRYRGSDVAVPIVLGQSGWQVRYAPAMAGGLDADCPDVGRASAVTRACSRRRRPAVRE